MSWYSVEKNILSTKKLRSSSYCFKESSTNSHTSCNSYCSISFNDSSSTFPCINLSIISCFKASPNGISPNSFVAPSENPAPRNLVLII